MLCSLISGRGKTETSNYELCILASKFEIKLVGAPKQRHRVGAKKCNIGLEYKSLERRDFEKQKDMENKS